MDASIIICTHNHLASLQATLAVLGRVQVPSGLRVEVLVVANACTDGTSAYLETVRLPHMVCCPLHEPVKGQVRARNLALSAARGQFILFIDDDVHPSPDWLARLCTRLATGGEDALIGAVRLAPHLERPWMTRRHRAMLSVTEGLEDGWLTEMIGANMAFHRRVLEKVPRFDEELGPGALGFLDDSLFSWQLEAAGFRLGRAPEAVVEHHCEEDRLLRERYLESARMNGRGRAYVMHHWKHETLRFALFHMIVAQLKMARRRLISRRDTEAGEGCAEWELSLTTEIARLRRYSIERRRPRNYQRHGLVKIPSGVV